MTREEAIKVLERISEDTIQRDCSTCGRTTAGTYTGVCRYCSLCKVVPEMFEDYHERKHFRSYWTWDGKRKNEALEMAISALRQQETVTERHELTNAQRIRAMSDEELAGFLLKLMGNVQCFGEGMFPYHPCPQDQNCKQCGIDWLQQPAGEEDKHEPTG